MSDVTLCPATVGFDSTENFALTQRVAKVFCYSSMVPSNYQGEKNLGNCVIAVNLARHLNIDPLAVMQNLYVIQGRPVWSTQFLISMFNACGKFSPIHYLNTGEKGTDSQGVIAYAYDKSSGEKLEGVEVTIALAKSEGWFSRNASKWKSMPEQMLRYRAASWFIRTTAPELTTLGSGFSSNHFTDDIKPVDDLNIDF